jgi:antagonist of KipI
MRGSRFDLLTEGGSKRLFAEYFTVTSRSDRMGYRLGESLELIPAPEPISEPVCPGTVQLPPNGEPVLLMADCQTTGGYPRVAQVISADLPVVAQLKPGDRLRFTETSLEEAGRAYQARSMELRQLGSSISRLYEQS